MDRENLTVVNLNEGLAFVGEQHSIVGDDTAAGGKQISPQLGKVRFLFCRFRDTAMQCMVVGSSHKGDMAEVLNQRVVVQIVGGIDQILHLGKTLVTDHAVEGVQLRVREAVQPLGKEVQLVHIHEGVLQESEL